MNNSIKKGKKSQLSEGRDSTEYCQEMTSDSLRTGMDVCEWCTSLALDDSALKNSKYSDRRVLILELRKFRRHKRDEQGEG